MEAMPKMEAKNPWKSGRFRRGMSDIVIMMAPVMIPAPPRPAMARPTIRATEFGATPHMRDPTSNIKIVQRNVLEKGVSGLM